MAIFNSYVKLPEGTCHICHPNPKALHLKHTFFGGQPGTPFPGRYHSWRCATVQNLNHRKPQMDFPARSSFSIVSYNLYITYVYCANFLITVNPYWFRVMQAPHLSPCHFWRTGARAPRHCMPTLLAGKLKSSGLAFIFGVVARRAWLKTSRLMVEIWMIFQHHGKPSWTIDWTIFNHWCFFRDLICSF